MPAPARILCLGVNYSEHAIEGAEELEHQDLVLKLLDAVPLAPSVPKHENGQPGEAAGILEIVDEGFGFLRRHGVMPAPDDIYVSSSQVRRFGLRIGEYKGLKCISHAGAWAGFRAHLVRFPGERFTVICLANLSDIDPGELSNRVADIYLAGWLKEPAKIQEKIPAAYPQRDWRAAT